MTELADKIEAAHTSGPWTDGNEAIHSRIDRKHPWCGTVFQRNHDGAEADALVAMSFAATPDAAAANARLIAAAPELLEALEALYAAKGRVRFGTDASAPNAHREMMRAAHAAIAKARGEAAALRAGGTDE